VICGRKKLPFAGYSIVKDHSGGNRPAETFGDLGAISPGPPSLAHSRGPKAPLRSLALSLKLPASLLGECRLHGQLLSHLYVPASLVLSEGWLANRSPPPLARDSRELRWAKVGEYRARTGDLLVANQALSQLS
jgi:hypothetical protein